VPRLRTRLIFKDRSKIKESRQGSIPRCSSYLSFSRLSTKESLTKQKGGGSLHCSRAVLAAKSAASGLLSAKPRGKSIRRAVFDVRNSTPTDFHNARIESLNHDERLPVLIVLGFSVYDELRAVSGRATLDHVDTRDYCPSATGLQTRQVSLRLFVELEFLGRYSRRVPG
jgi:hypothetical protein